MKLTIVVPCYNEEAALPASASRLLDLLRELQSKEKVSATSEILFVDDGSTDNTWSLIERLADEHSCVHGRKLSRNQGHQNALVAGVLGVDADAVVSIDADLQDDVAVIEAMVDAYHDGYEIVYGVRANRESDSAFKRFTAEGYYHLLRLMGVDIVYNHADFRLLGRRAIDALRAYGEVNLFLRGIIPLLGFRSTKVYYPRRERAAGESKYPMRRMAGLAIDGVTSFSAAPLRLIFFLGIITFVISSAFGVWALVIRLFTNEAVPGWASTVVPTYFLGGVQLLSIGVIGEYLAKIYLEVKRRPRFHVEKER